MIATILISLAILMICAAIIVGIVKDKKRGSCSCGCSNCAMSKFCHKK